MGNRKNHICPVKRAGILDYRIRRWLQNPQKILGPYIEEGMTVVDHCWPRTVEFGVTTADFIGLFGYYSHCFKIRFTAEPRRSLRKIFLLIQSGLRRAVAASSAQAGGGDLIRNCFPSTIRQGLLEGLGSL